MGHTMMRIEMHETDGVKYELAKGGPDMTNVCWTKDDIKSMETDYKTILSKQFPPMFNLFNFSLDMKFEYPWISFRGTFGFGEWMGDIEPLKFPFPQKTRLPPIDLTGTESIYPPGQGLHSGSCAATAPPIEVIKEKIARINIPYVKGKGDHWSRWENSFDGPLDFQCNSRSAITGVESTHSNGHRDRRFKFRCTVFAVSDRDLIYIRSDRSWHPRQPIFQNEVQIDASNDNRVVSGWKSHHSNQHEDRKMSLQYVELSRPAKLGVCRDMGYTKTTDTWKVECDQGEALTGFDSYFEVESLDRSFNFKCCEVKSK
jgi:hypothetical protein